MSKIDLPLWNSDETDVLPAFQLSFGHVITRKTIANDITLLAKILRLQRYEQSDTLDVKRLPLVTATSTVALQTQSQVHMLLVPSGNCSVLFAPHSLFFGNAHWIEWSRKIKNLVIIVVRHSLTETSYRVFDHGKLIATAWHDGNGIRFLHDPDVYVYLHGTLVAKSSSGVQNSYGGALELIEDDLRIALIDSKVVIRHWQSEDVIGYESVVHFSFQR